MSRILANAPNHIIAIPDVRLSHNWISKIRRFPMLKFSKFTTLQSYRIALIDLGVAIFSFVIAICKYN